ncbi:MAG TPA: glycerophosphodiester phosphodiesterase [Longimicrobium sp.]|nr:glycerophosphodiester phosphodiesterase [Longimicrobium sp.]
MPPAPRALILGHRGAPRGAPENTMRAFRLALEEGADGVELDVQPSADGVPVVLHDDTLDRTTDQSGDVSVLPWERIAAARSEGEPVPRLEEVVAWAAETGAFLNVELKRPGAEAAAVAAVARAGLRERTVFSSFLAASVAEVRRLDPAAACYFLSDGRAGLAMAVARQLGAWGVCLGARRATPAALAEFRRAGLPVIVWTVDRPYRIRGLLREGVRGIITNLPSLAVQVRAEVEAELLAPARPM